MNKYEKLLDKILPLERDIVEIHQEILKGTYYREDIYEQKRKEMRDIIGIATGDVLQVSRLILFFNYMYSIIKEVENE